MRPADSYITFNLSAREKLILSIFQGWNLFRFFRNSGFFFSSPLSSPAIAVFQAIFSRPKTPAFFSTQTCRHFFPARICRHFDPIRYYWHFFPARICRHFFSGPKLPAYFPTQNCRHISVREIAGIFFRHEIAASKSPSSFLSSVQWTKSVAVDQLHA